MLSLAVSAHAAVSAQAWVQRLPNANDRAAAINAGDFRAYTNQLIAWLNQQVPAEPAKITKEKMMALLNDPVFLGALAERQFLGKVWDSPDLGG